MVGNGKIILFPRETKCKQETAKKADRLIWLKRLKKEIERKEVKINMLECVIMKLKKG